MKFLILGMIGLFVGAAVTEFPIPFSLEIAISIGLLSLWLIAANAEYISREYRLIKSLERERNSLLPVTHPVLPPPTLKGFFYV